MQQSYEHPLRPYYVAPTPSNSTPPIIAPPPEDPPFNPYARYTAQPAESNIDVRQVLRTIAVSVAIGFGSTSCVTPFEVGKTLAQVQWISKDLIASKTPNEDDETAEDLESDTEINDYFTDALSKPRVTPTEPGRTHPTSNDGYLSRTGELGELMRPVWVIPVVVDTGVWDMMKSMARWRGEGWTSLWKGNLTNYILDLSTTTMQPISVALVNWCFPSQALLLHPHPVPFVLMRTAAFTITTFLTSPLDLVRTRLMVQSSQSAHRKYTGPLDALAQITNDEGGWYGVYFHPQILIPTLLDGIIRPLTQLAAPLVLEHVFGLSQENSPVFFAVCEFIGSCIGLALVLPIETVRKRLQIQTRGAKKEALKACVETRPVPYRGVMDCIYQIVREERSRIPKSRRTESGEESAQTTGSTGILQLYRGFGMGVAANLTVFLLTLVAGRDATDGWAEV